MMNLEKMKQKKSKNSVKKGLLAATTILCLTSPMLQTQSVLAAENTAPAITIEKPDGWRQGETAVAITVDASHMPEGFSITKIEAKAGKDGSWQDVTGNGSISITGNQTVYVRVTDGDGKVYEQNRSIKCYDTEKPTLSASLTDGILMQLYHLLNDQLWSAAISQTPSCHGKAFGKSVDHDRSLPHPWQSCN